jgi:hypothetical protein
MTLVLQELTFKDRSCCQESLHVSDSKQVCTRIDGFGASSGKSISEELDVSCLIGCEVLDAAIGRLIKASLLKIVHSVICKALTVESVL